MNQEAHAADTRPSHLLFQQRVRIFCSLCETQSFTQTARSLNLSQSAVSRTIQDLESELHVRLFDHSVRPVRVTKAGESLYQLLLAESIAIDDQLSRLKASKELLSPLRIGFVESLARSMSWSIISALKDRCSTITVLTGVCSHLMRLLEENSIDVFLSSDPLVFRNDLDRRFLFREPSIILAPKSYGLPAKPTWEQIQLSGLPMILFHKGNAGGNLDKKFFNKLGLNFFHRIEVDINATAMDYVAHGAGWTITRPTSLVQHPDLAKQVAVLEMPAPTASRELYVISRKGFNSELADEIAELAVAAFVRDVVPAMVRRAPWIRPYLFIRGEGDQRTPLFKDCKKSADSDVYIL